jgi:hypothetical protein
MLLTSCKSLPKDSDVSERLTKIIHSELQRVEENNLTENDLKGLSDIQRWTNLPF